MTDFKRIEEELRFAAVYGCDHTLLIEAADALHKAKKIIDDAILNDRKGPNTVYVQLQTFTTEGERRKLEKILNESSPDAIVVLPPCVQMVNPECLDEVNTDTVTEEETKDKE